MARAISTKERESEGTLFNIFDFAFTDGNHQMLSLSVDKGKIGRWK